MHKAVTKIASCRVSEISERDIENKESFVSSQNSQVLGPKVANLKSGLWPLVTALEPPYKTKACN